MYRTKEQPDYSTLQSKGHQSLLSVIHNYRCVYDKWDYQTSFEIRFARAMTKLLETCLLNEETAPEWGDHTFPACEICQL